MPAWQGSTRAQRLPPDWHKRRARTWRAAGGRCQHTDPTTHERCTWTGRLNGDGGQCDHINGWTDNDTLQWLCPHHHQAKTQHEAAAVRHPDRPVKPQHPGLLLNHPASQPGGHP